MDKRPVPTIEEIDELYRREIRKKSLEESYDEGKLGERSFFSNFRRVNLPNEAENILDDYKVEYLKKYKNFKYLKTSSQGEKIKEIENQIEYEKFFLRYERKINKEKTKSRHYGSNQATRYRVDRIKKLEGDLNRLLEQSKEGWEYYYSRKLMEDIESKKNQSLVEVPYVVESKDKIVESLNLGVPVYLVGHLGSGKTQLATEAAIDFTIQNRLQEDLEEAMEEWFVKNPKLTETDALEEFKKVNEKRKNYYSQLVHNGNKEEIERIQPLFISGSHNLTYEDMFVEKTLSLSHSFSEGSYSDYLNMLIEDFYDWMEDHEEKLSKMTEEEKLQLKIQIWKSFSDLLVASNSAFGTEIKKVEREILVAVKEGRVVIIDELNTIAMQNLIGLNDILQRHAGMKAYITGVGPVEIKEGFGFIGTGNLSSQMVSYEGTNELNPAFKSRFTTIEYNYLPQNIRGSLYDQNNPNENQLFRIILGQLADENGSIQLPDPKRSLEELFRFAQLSKLTQDIFMGRLDGEVFNEDIGGDQPELRESVLSIRNILHVLDNWNRGEEKDLSKALWDGFISSITYPDDQNYILAQAVRYGFFPREDGWNVVTKAIGSSTRDYEEIRLRAYDYTRRDLGVVSYLDIIYLLFDGKKIAYSKDILEMFSNEDGEVPNIDVEKYEELNSELSKLDHSLDLLDNMKKCRDRNEA